LLADPISNIPAQESKWFWDLVQRHGSDRSFVRTATLVLRYNLEMQRPALIAPRLIESPYTWKVRVVDIRGRNYDAHFEGWWFPEWLENDQEKTKRPWWKFWVRLRWGLNV
jgi:hypothetical protein